MKRLEAVRLLEGIYHAARHDEQREAQKLAPTDALIEARFTQVIALVGIAVSDALYDVGAESELPGPPG